MIERIGIGRRNSDASIFNGIAHFAMTPQKPYDAALSAGDQMRQVLEKTDARLKELGAMRCDVIFVTLVLSDSRYLGEVNAAWDAWIDPESPPTRACIIVGLADPSMKVELIIQADVHGAGR